MDCLFVMVPCNSEHNSYYLEALKIPFNNVFKAESQNKPSNGFIRVLGRPLSLILYESPCFKDIFRLNHSFSSSFFSRNLNLSKLSKKKSNSGVQATVKTSGFFYFFKTIQFLVKIQRKCNLIFLKDLTSP